MGKVYFEEYIGTVQNTGWPIDGHRLIFGLWDYDNRSCYHLHGWDDADDEAVKQTMFRTMVDGGFICEEDKDEFMMVWKDGLFDDVYCPGSFCIDLELRVNVTLSLRAFDIDECKSRLRFLNLLPVDVTLVM